MDTTTAPAPETTTGPIDVTTIQLDDTTRRDNGATWRSTHVDECFVCGRGMTRAGVDRAWFIHLATDGTILPKDVELPADDPLDQGWFPVGSECAKRVPTTHRARIGA